MQHDPMALEPVRDPAPLLALTRARWGGQRDLWVFGYGSLIARPGFMPAERHVARVHGYHRALCMRSRINRGTPECPGLVFALVSGGSCRGVAFRIPAAEAAVELERLWLREMPTGVYDPRWLACDTPAGRVEALAFTLDRRSPGYVGLPADDELRHILRHARGRYGTTRDYVLETAEALRGCGIRDRAIERIVALARHVGMAEGTAGGVVAQAVSSGHGR